MLLRNAANTGFASEAAAIPVGASPEGIEAADFNGDGYPDIAVAVLGTNTVNVLLRNPAAASPRRRRSRSAPARSAWRPPTSTPTGDPTSR